MFDLRLIKECNTVAKVKHFYITKQGYAGYGEIIVTFNPFGNCQIYTIGYMNNILSKVSDYGKSTAMDLLRKIQSYGTKNMVQFDVSAGYMIRVRDLFDGYIKYEHPYISSNGSAMVTVLAGTGCIR